MCHSAMSLCSKWSKLHRRVQAASSHTPNFRAQPRQQDVFILLTLLKWKVLIVWRVKVDLAHVCPLV